jgi:hypothetical protein
MIFGLPYENGVMGMIFRQTQITLPHNRVKWDGVTKAPDLEPVISDKAIGIDFSRKLVLSWFAR